MTDTNSLHKRRIYLPIYPKAFIALARFPRERDRVFVAMPFEAKHSDSLWNVVQGVCKIRELNARRADSSVYPNPIVADILEELEKAEIVIADLTGLTPNVLYELGIAHVRCDSVVLLCQEGQKLPFDLAFIRCIFYDLSTEKGRVNLAERLGKTIDELRIVGPPVVIDSPLERTKLIIRDLQELTTLPDDDLVKETVWFSGSFSSFAISSEEPFLPAEAEYHCALISERDTLLTIARRGCRIKCIITPPNPDNFRPATAYYARRRIEHLLKFLESGDKALKNIEWAVSPFAQKNFYIMGRISCFEGYKKGIERGYALAIRQTGGDAITANVSLYEVLFDWLATDTLTSYGKSGKGGRQEALRQATINCLRKSLKFLQKQEKKPKAKKREERPRKRQ